MPDFTIETITSRDRWNETLHTLPYAHVLQTWEWGEFKKATTGWQPERIQFSQDGKVVAMASVQTRSIGPLKAMYIPKGPALDFTDQVLTDAVLESLEKLARSRRAVWLKIDPDVIGWTGVPSEEDDLPDTAGQAMIESLQRRKWRYSEFQPQFRNTFLIDLTASEDDLLAQMSQNTRRKVRTGPKKDVTIREATTADLDTLYVLYQITGERDAFLIRPSEYYEKAWRDFMQAGLAHALIAESEGEALAHVILFHFGQKCWYFYGASSNEQRNKMPTYLLQWEAIKWAKAQGYRFYDMWGAPNEFIESDPMWGVYEFKRGFRGAVTRHIGAWDYAPNGLLYRAYVEIWPRILNALRR